VTRDSDAAGEPHFSLVHGGPLYGAQRALGLIPDHGLGVRRRILVFVALSWLPVAIGAIAIGRAFGADTAEPLSHHFAVHARCLVAIPLLLVAELFAERWLPVLLHYFVESGLVPASEHAGFRDALRAAAKVRDSGWGQLLVIGVTLSSVVGSLTGALFAHEVVWAVSGTGASERLAFAGAWYLLVSRPLFLMLVLIWIWRIAVLCVLFRRIARLDLQLVAIHPDRAAGLGFLDVLPQVAAPVTLALSAVLASQLAHEVLYHGMHVSSLRPLMIAWVVITTAGLLLPLLPFCQLLTRMRRTARLRYGDLFGDHGRLFEARWISRARSNEQLLGAQEISAATDAIALYQAVETLRPMPFGLRSLAPLLAAAALPMLPVFAIEIPIKDLLMRIAKALI
jgi:hypothetical protein